MLALLFSSNEKEVFNLILEDWGLWRLFPPVIGVVVELYRKMY
jgi:hypothetical protein